VPKLTIFLYLNLLVTATSNHLQGLSWSANDAARAENVHYSHTEQQTDKIGKTLALARHPIDLTAGPTE
jgi:hypothetical protein